MEQLKSESRHVFHEVTKALRLLIEAQRWAPAVDIGHWSAGRAAERAEGGNIFITMHLVTTRLVADVRCVPTLVLTLGPGGRQHCSRAGWLGDRHRRTVQFVCPGW